MKSFKTPGELFAYISEQNRRSDAAIEDWQLALKPGDYAMRWWSPSSDRRVDPNAADTFTIYYEIIEPQYEEDKATLGTRNRLVNGYSIACPEGELGSCHVAHFHAPLTKEAFERARRQGWPSIR